MAHDVIKDDWLTKQGGRVKSWKRRFFRLTGKPSLEYFENEHAGRPKGVIVLTTFTRVAEAEDVGKRKFVFTVQTNPESRSFIIVAESAESRRSWIEAIRAVVAAEAARYPDGRPNATPLTAAAATPAAAAAADADADGSSGDEVERTRVALTDLEVRADPEEAALQRRSTIAADIHKAKENEKAAADLDGSSFLGPEPQACLSRLDEVLAKICEAMASPEPDVRLNAVVAVRKLLSIEENPPIEQCTTAGMVPTLCTFLGPESSTQLQFESAWALTNVASGSSAHTREIVMHGAIPLFNDLLSSPSENVREQAVWGLGNIAGDSCAMRDEVLQSGAFDQVLATLGEQLDSEAPSTPFLRNLTWTLSNMTRGKSPHPDFTIIRAALPMLRRLIMLEDQEVLTDALWALSYLSDGTNDKIQAVVDAAVVERVVSLMTHPSSAIMTPALRTVGNIVTGTSEQVAVVLHCGALPRLRTLLSSPRLAIRKEAIWALSNVTADGENHCQAVIDADIFPLIVRLLEAGETIEKHEAAWVVANLFDSGNSDQTLKVASMGAIKPMCDLLNETRVTQCILEGLVRAVTQCSDVISMILDADCTDKLEEFEESSVAAIAEKAQQLLTHLEAMPPK